MKKSTKGHAEKRRGHTSGSRAPSSERMHGGEYEGAGEMPARGPGKAAETRHGLSRSEPYLEANASGKGKAPNHTRGQEEDGE